MVSCRICKGDHWTTKCPYKDSLAPLQESLDADKKKDEPASNAAQQASAGGPRAGKYVPPSLREGGNRKGESMSLKNRGLSSICCISSCCRNILLSHPICQLSLLPCVGW